MCTFNQHVSGGEAREVFRSLPRQVQPLLERCMIHRTEEAAPFGRDELLRRGSEHLGVAGAEAEAITSAVLKSISSRLPAQEVSAVAAQLPRDLRELWVVPRLPLGAPTAQHPVLTRIEQSVKLPAGVTGEGAFKVVTCHLSRRLTRGEAGHFIQALPAELRQLVEDCLNDRGEHPEPFDKDTFVARVASELRMGGDIGRADEIVRKVFRSVEEYIRADVFKHVMGQLPRELADLWALPDLH
jgi:uncharacterized protein (DUF2267 family)